MLRSIAVLATLISVIALPAALANGVAPVTTAPVVTPQPVQVQPTPTQPAMTGAGPVQLMAQYPANAVAVDNNSIYVVSNNQLWKVNKFSGQLMGCTMLPDTQCQPSSTGAGPVISQPSTTGAGPATTVPGTSTTPSIEVPLPPTELNPNEPSNVPNPVTGQIGTPSGAGPSTGYTQQATVGTSTGAYYGAGPALSSQPSVAVDQNTVYVVRGNQIMRFRSDNLQFVGSCPLVTSQMVSQPGMLGAGPAACVTGPTQPITYTPTTGAAVCPPISMPAQPGSGPAACAPSTIAVATSPDITTDIRNMRGLDSCTMEQNYMRSIVRANAGAIVWSQLAQQKASQPQLQDFATNEIAILCEQNQKVQQQLGKWYSMEAPVVVSPSDAQTYANLQKLSGTDFDVAYMQAMLGHFKGVSELSSGMQQRVCHSEAGRAISTLRNTQSRQSAQLRTWLRDWYNVTVR